MKKLLLVLMTCSTILAAQLKQQPMNAEHSAHEVADMTSAQKSQPTKKIYTLDRIEAVIFGAETTEIVTLSDINRAGFDGRAKNKEDVILERLMFQDALKHRIMIDEKTIDEYIDKMRKSFNATMDDIKVMFEQAGYTFEEGRRQLGIMYGSNQMVDFKVRSRLIIPEKDVQAFYDDNPVVRPASFIIERAFIPAHASTKEDIQNKVDRYLQTGKGINIQWYQLPEITESDLAESRRFITKLPVGEISELIETQDGFDLYRVKNKREPVLVPLEDRYREIVEILRKPKFDELVEDYKTNLLRNGSIIYF
jgi:hypothetical protein